MAKSSTKTKTPTPLMKQYFQVKSKYPDSILLFRVGDFYETFGEDAITASKVLGIVLTNRNNGGSKIELAGFPYHSLDLYLPRLVRAGFRVAICEQLEKPSKEKKIVKRGVTEVVTPGVATESNLLNHDKNNFLASVSFGKKGKMGIAFLDISTGEFFISEGAESYIKMLIQSFQPAEIIFSKDRKKNLETFNLNGAHPFHLDEWVYSFDYCREKLLEHFQVKSLKGFGVEALELGQIAAGAVMHYLAFTENTEIAHINNITSVPHQDFVWMDQFTIRNLELLGSNGQGGMSLINVLDKTLCPMGARLLKKWVALPLINKDEITSRHDSVEFLLTNPTIKEKLSKLIKLVGDLERLSSKIPMGKITPRELLVLNQGLTCIQPLNDILDQTNVEALKNLASNLDECASLQQMIGAQIHPEAVHNTLKGGYIADGFNEELDEFRHLIKNSKDILIEIQKREAERTGIDNLKIGFNNVFGYYLEVTNKHKGKGLVPEEWIRKQTLTNAERYITPELKELEQKILVAEEKVLALEQRIYKQLVIDLVEYIPPIQKNARAIATLDCLYAFASVAERNNYVKPVMDESYDLEIKAGRHPVIEAQMAVDESYIPNDVFLSNEKDQILMITGPNMAGKSALLRQTALIALMAQMGSFVPADQLRMGVVDKVFTRVGASDNISTGESTFMIEMNETASIMNNISERSLILLDEIGRGTSTYDGISIAWSIAEYLHANSTAQPKTLFATHYHELNDLAGRFDRIRNYHISTKEIGQKVIFLRKMVEGGAHHSFGIHVAKMAGMPKAIVDRANHILSQLEQKSIDGETDFDAAVNVKEVRADQINQAAALQLSIFEKSDPAIGQIRAFLADMELNSMTPIECMMKLNELKKLAESNVEA